MDTETVRLEKVSADAQLKMYLMACLYEGGIIVVKPDNGPSFRFEQADENKYERTNISTGTTSVIDAGLLTTHFRYGTGEVELSCPSEQ